MKLINSALIAIATAAVLTAGSANASVSANLIKNGSFESTVVSDPYRTLGSSTSVLTNWTINAGSVDLIGSYWNAQDGHQSLDMNGSAANGVISQSFATTAGQRYNVSFWIAGNPDDSFKTKSLVADVAGQSYAYAFNTTGKSRTNMGWTEEGFSFVASGSTSSLKFSSTQAPNSNGSVSSWGLALDNVSVTAVPEPETYAMLLAGLGLMGAIAKRRKANQG